ncbi:MAG TPA: carbamoyl-phosphate synthase large subunit [Syntrophales bacterium]|nr:carbamoyl-phosphate synthase large subunit [Syntrophales bacterium]HRS87782.1 carbamoyl-phosphate synthase large subunit [Syntrophales bacterium]HRV43258.1 carbamoyl-phosphate synthase large subunit [Syntrophales bacterium]
MPKRRDIKKILIIGSGPIVIGQACEFDYSGTQACKALREEGYEIVLVNSNPATIMTDPETAHRTYVEPITPEAVAKIIARERPDALLPTLGGQTGLNTAVALAEGGVLERWGVEMIGASPEVIVKAEDREKFRAAMERIGLRVPRSSVARTMEEVRRLGASMPFPVIVRPSFTLGGTGSGIAYNREELLEIAKDGLDKSPIGEIILEESLLGWKEFELEVMRDRADNVVIICSIENLDPMGVHTGDSITVAPAQTLTDREYQRMRDAAVAVMREIGVDTGGSNVQFAVNPATGDLVVIEMNPRVSRSSALASKATGFPIAKIAAKLAVGYTLDEIPNDITKETMASFEPAIDYVVTKIPRWTFEKFPDTPDVLTTSMKSVGETMAVGRTFKESLQKAIRSLEIGRFGLVERVPGDSPPDREFFAPRLATPNSRRLFWVASALWHGLTVEEAAERTRIDPWFLHHIAEIVAAEKTLFMTTPSPEALREAKRWGFSDRRLGELWQMDEASVRRLRHEHGIRRVYKVVDTCAAEFEAYTPYYYGTFETESEAAAGGGDKVVIIGGGPNRIGQGIEFDYCCVHASYALREEGIRSVMINSNPETVSTDYDTSDRLFFEPLTLEDVLDVIETVKPLGVIVQFGGQTPLNLARDLAAAGVKILGTSPDAIDRAEDRRRFQEIVDLLRLRQPPNATALTKAEAEAEAEAIGYPVMVRPSYVLGGRAMEIVYDRDHLRRFIDRAFEVSPGRPVLIDKFLEDAVEVDVDAVSDGRETVVAGIMEHIEEAGIHSGDSACILPALTLPPSVLALIEEQTKTIAAALGVVGLMNIQYAVKGEELYVLEVNPRASRTVPFVSKAIGVPLAKVATKVMLGRTLRDLGFTAPPRLNHIAVKEAVFPFGRFPGVDILLGPEMKSTGEVMGIDTSFGLAFAKSQMAAGFRLPLSGTVYISVHDLHKERIVPVAAAFRDLGFRLWASRGTASHLRDRGLEVRGVNKLSEGRPHVVDHIKNGEIQLMINTSLGRRSSRDGYEIRRSALLYNVPYTTTIAGARAVAAAVAALRGGDWGVRSLQEYHGG